MRLTGFEVAETVLGAMYATGVIALIAELRRLRRRIRREEARRALARARRLRPQPPLTQADADAAWDRVADAIRDERAYLPERERIATAADQPVPYKLADPWDFWEDDLAKGSER